MNYEKHEERSRKEDAVLNRVLIWFGAAVVAEFIMLLLNRFYINYTTASAEILFASTLTKILWPVSLVALVGAAACAAWYLSRSKIGGKTGLPFVLGWVCLAVSVCFGITHWFRATGVQFLLGAVPVVAVMALVYYLYQREFFTVTVLSAVGILGLWIIRKSNEGHSVLVYGYVAAAAVALLLAVLLFRVLQKNGGVLVRGEREFQVFPSGANYGMLYLSCGVVAAVLIAACFLGTAVAYYLIFALVAWLFVMAVYYTVKLM